MRKLLAVSLLLSLLFVPDATATTPGSDGLILFAYESPVPDEQLTQVDLYTLEPDGSGLTQITRTPHRMELGAVWSPDGTRIAFSRTKAPFGHGSIWVTDAQGRHGVRLTEGIDARDPAWSPDGRRIAFSRFDGRGGPNLYTMRASDGGGMRRLTSWRSLEFMPAWSPDGTTIAFTRGWWQGDPGDIWMLDVATLEAHRVTSSPTYDHGADWSPDGALLVFQRTRLHTAKIATVHPDGTGFSALTSGHWDADPVWSPSGTSIAFSSDRRTTFLPDLWTMDADGTHLQRLRNLLFASTEPSWQAVPAQAREP